MQKKTLKIHLLTSVVSTDLTHELNALLSMMRKNISVLTKYKIAAPTPHVLTKRQSKGFKSDTRFFTNFSG